ncbi:MAG: hypothetical protein EOP53_13370 [Sphingobacteriales bacterium]|nr:MAG: hypothetical protein EOP53_13370 [Sphingobacteriales bacterium]
MGVRSLALPENAPEQPVSSGNTTGLNTTGGLAREQEEQGTHGRPPQDAGKGAAGREKDVDNLVASAYMFAMQTLYKGRHFNDLEHAHAQSYIKIYYTQSKNLNTAHIGFLERIILKKYQMDRHPEYFMPPPSCYFNPVFEHGFVWTKDKYREIREKRMQQADYYSNIRLFVDLYRNYSKNPGIEFYRKAEVQLGKLRDGQRLLQMFYSCVTNPDDYINQIDNYKNHATTNGQKN